MSADGKQAIYSIQEWCFASRISAPLFFKEKREGRGPRIAHVGRRTIVIESPCDYYSRIANEAESAIVAVDPVAA
jgi:hypothetical protein